MKFLVLLISFTVFVFSQVIGLADLAVLVSKDIGKKVVIADNLNASDYQIDLDLSSEYNLGELTDIFKTYLVQNDLSLIDHGDSWLVIKNNYTSKSAVLPKLPVAPDAVKKHYYMYRIQHITNEDVANVLSIFTDELGEPIKYIYLKQSDMIAYAATPSMHTKIKKMLSSSDNSVLQRKIKISFFTLDSSKLSEIGSDIEKLAYSMDFSFTGLVDSLLHNNRVTLNSSDTGTFKFLLYALESRGVAKIYHEPTLVLTNGVKTSLSYVKNIGYKVSTTTVKENIETTKDSIKYRDVGFQMTILPKISDDWIFLDLNLISENLIAMQDNVPLTQKISYHSKVKVYNDRPLLLSGLKKSSQRTETNAIPLISSVPLLGSFFKFDKKDHSSQTIYILIEVI
ncbi:Phage assembly protein |uniref:Phage assembly protein \